MFSKHLNYCLIVTDVPGRPGQPVVTQTSSSKALIIWDAPKSVGHSDVLFYKVDYKEQSKMINLVLYI